LIIYELNITFYFSQKSGVPQAVPALTINRLCGSGFETVIQGATAIRVGDANVTICGGAENMSAAPLQLDGNDVRWGVTLGSGLKMRDALWDGLTDSYANTPMGITAENLAELYNITREECDAFAIRSQRTWDVANKNKVFELEMAPVEIITKKGNKVIDTDEHPRPDSTVNKISTLKPVFKKDGVVTAASASGICDGAGAIILATESAVKEHNLTPLARLVSYQVSGCDPKIMGTFLLLSRFYVNSLNIVLAHFSHFHPFCTIHGSNRNWTCSRYSRGVAKSQFEHSRCGPI